MLSVREKKKEKIGSVDSPKILFEDSALLVVDKPSGMITNDASTVVGQTTLQSWLFENFDYEIAKDHFCRSGVVHRLDKETSGILLVAKTKKAFEALQKEFKERTVTKEYIALAHGMVMPEKGKIEAAVGRLPWNRRRFGVLQGGREAVTEYEVKDYYEREGEKYSLLRLMPKTGRTHQIRIHLKYIGYPIFSDTFYAGRKTSRRDRQVIPRLFLHASEITFKHPKTGETIEISDPLPEDLKNPLHEFFIRLNLS